MSDQNTSIRETGLGRLLQQFAGSVNLNELIGIYLDQVQALEDAAWPLLGERSLDNATGDRLDGLGEIVVVKRAGRNDTEYRAVLKAEFAVLRSNGTAEDLLTIAQLFIQMPTPEYEFLEYYPKTVYLRAVNYPLPTTSLAVTTSLRRVVSAGTQLLFVYAHNSDGVLFSFSSSPTASESSTQTGLGNDVQTTGGYLTGSW